MKRRYITPKILIEEEDFDPCMLVTVSQKSATDHEAESKESIFNSDDTGIDASDNSSSDFVFDFEE